MKPETKEESESESEYVPTSSEERRANKELNLNPTIQKDSEESSNWETEEEDSEHKEATKVEDQVAVREFPRLGGTGACEDHHITMLKEGVNKIRDQKLLHLNQLYDENIISCEYQLVSGSIFNAIIEIDSQRCRLHFW